jgi:hypothetical protein
MKRLLCAGQDAQFYFLNDPMSAIRPCKNDDSYSVDGYSRNLSSSLSNAYFDTIPPDWYKYKLGKILAWIFSKDSLSVICPLALPQLHHVDCYSVT